MNPILLKTELHVFALASQKAYNTAVYAKFKVKSGFN